jgi:hypothetical protein
MVVAWTAVRCTDTWEMRERRFNDALKSCNARRKVLVCFAGRVGLAEFGNFARQALVWERQWEKSANEINGTTSHASTAPGDRTIIMRIERWAKVINLRSGEFFGVLSASGDDTLRRNSWMNDVRL